MTATSYRVFLATAPGLEAPLRSEVSRILQSMATRGDTGPATKKRIEVKEAGVEANCSQQELWRLALTCRCCTDVRVRVGRPFEAQNLDQLVRRFGQLPWRAWLPTSDGALPSVSAVCRRSLVYHSAAVRERVEHWLRDNLPTLTTTGDEEQATSGLHVRVSKNHCSASLAVGRVDQHHYQRGYRHHVVPGSLREPLAASLIEATGWPTAPGPLWNPFAGSGVLATEALLLASPLFAPALRFGHALGFQRYRNHDAAAYQRFLDASGVAGRLSATLSHRCYLSDLSPRALDAAKHNAQQLGVDPVLLAGDAAHVLHRIPANAIIVANPPYGKQCAKRPTDSVDGLHDLLVAAGRTDLLQRAYFLVAAADRVRAPHDNLFFFKNGGLAVRFIRLRTAQPDQINDQMSSQ